MRLLRSFPCFLALLGFLTGPAPGAIYYVSPDGSHTAPFTNWPGAATNVLDAVGLATDGDTVLVTNGHYILTDQIVLTNGVTLASVNGRDVTVLERPGSTAGHPRCARLGHSNAVVSGFTLTNGWSWSGDGGVVYIGNGGTVSDCIVTGGDSLYGGGIYVAVTGAVLRCVVQGNTAEVGGGIWCKNTLLASSWILNNAAEFQGGGVSCSDLTLITNCVVRGNVTLVTTDHGWGGGISGGGTGSRVSHCLVESNSAGRGAGIFDLGEMLISHSIIRNNTASLDGGGMMLDGRAYACRIDGNRANKGGGVWCWPFAEISNCLVISNSASVAIPSEARQGGGVYLPKTGTIDSSTVTKNWADTAGGIYVDEAGVSVRNSIVYGNLANGSGVNVTGLADLLHCCVTPDPGGIGNVTAPPVFRGPNDYRLRYDDTACRDAGTNLVTGLEDFDLGGRPRLVGPAVDIGAYEFLEQIQEPIFVRGKFTPRWHVVQGAMYRFQRSTEPVQGGWENLGEAFEATLPAVVYYENDLTLSNALYRLQFIAP